MTASCRRHRARTGRMDRRVRQWSPPAGQRRPYCQTLFCSQPAADQPLAKVILGGAFVSGHGASRPSHLTVTLTGHSAGRPKRAASYGPGTFTEEDSVKDAPEHRDRTTTRSTTSPRQIGTSGGTNPRGLTLLPNGWIRPPDRRPAIQDGRRARQAGEWTGSSSQHS